ncbi:ATP nucleotide 3'-pyrophosphokinase [Streptomyces sp. NPDC006670]|uniref:ATP nucleotide 3'-pyrophosphokinase n=1 Tax=Streptomyces sp. NPDC006670 TaxID=3154476 RepID=UPI0033DF4132
MSTHHLGRTAAVLAAALALATATTGLTAYAATPSDSTGKHATAVRCADDPDGWHRDGLCLDATDNRKVDAYLAHARAAEKEISSDVKAAAILSQAELVGFDHRLKSPDSLKRKVATDLKEHPERNTDDVLARLTDAVRYTLQWSDKDYVAGVTLASKALSIWDNDSTKWSNTWGRKGYKGLNTGWRAPGSRQLFEVQFHTPASKYAQEETHKLYEEQRLPSTSPERKKELQEQQDAIFASVPVPDGAPALAAPGRPALTPAA